MVEYKGKKILILLVLSGSISLFCAAYFGEEAICASSSRQMADILEVGDNL